MEEVRENGGYACGRQDFNNTTVDPESESYKRLSLISNNLVGTIPEEVYWLTSMETVTLTTNSIKGTNSSGVGVLTNLISLTLVSLELEGSLPSEVGLLTKLTSLVLYTNNLSGSMPSEIVRSLTLAHACFVESLTNPFVASSVFQTGRPSRARRTIFGGECLYRDNTD